MLAGTDLSNRLSFDVQGAAALRLKATSGDPAALKAAAKQFEAMFVQTMLKTMRATHFTSEGDVFGDSSSLKLYQELLDQQWAQNIVGNKGFGLADMIVKRLTLATVDPATLQDDTAVKTAPQGAKANASTSALPAATALPGVLHQQATPHGTTDQTGDATEQSPGRNGRGNQNPDRKQRFVEAMLPYAQEAEKVSGIPARFVLAHAGLESGWGRHEIVAADGTASHNLFGIKADGGWDGHAVSTVTTEYRQGLAMKISAKFRAYANYAEGFIDYARLLKRRYQDAVAAGHDAQAFATGLVAGGYATDPSYAEKLKGVIHSISLVGA
jgi:flagellar protein FlgJ